VCVDLFCFSLLFPFYKKVVFFSFFSFFFIFFFSKNTRLLSCLSKKKAGQKTPTQKSNDHIKVDVTLIKRGRVGKTEARRKRRLCVSSERVPHPHRVPLPSPLRGAARRRRRRGRRSTPSFVVGSKALFCLGKRDTKRDSSSPFFFFFASLLLLLLAR
jgi:hypothetical protein